MKLRCEEYLIEQKDILKNEVKKIKEKTGKNLKIVLFKPKTGDEIQDNANNLYVRNKTKHLNDIGVEVLVVEDIPKVDKDYSECGEKLPCLVQKTNDFDSHLKIIEQSPYLFDIEYVNDLLSYSKVPTPNGAVNMLQRLYGVDFTGKKCVIINRSEIIGIPLMRRLLDENASVTVHHSKSKKEDLIKDCENADFIFTGVGKVGFLNQEKIPYSLDKISFIIDFGINRDDVGLCGDIDRSWVDILNKSGQIYYTPTPKGTGLTTIAQLLEEVVNYYKEV